MKRKRNPQGALRKHSLSLAALAVVVFLIVLYHRSNPDTHMGAFFGNAIADWTGVLITVVMTKHLYEKGSAESKQPKGKVRSAAVEWLREHSLTLFLLLTGIAWVVAFKAMDPNSKWGQVVGNLVSEWTQILGLVLMTKRLMEVGSGALTAVRAAYTRSCDSSNQLLNPPRAYCILRAQFRSVSRAFASEDWIHVARALKQFL